MNRHFSIFLFAILLLGCSDNGEEPPLLHPTLIVAKVHWEDQGIPDIPIVLLQTGDSVRTDSLGQAVFSVSPGKYVIRAYGINRGGPVYRYIDFEAEAKQGETVLVDIVDCLPCV